MHHKFVVLDFDTADARVYLGSYNFSEPADGKNGENLLLIKDRTVATSSHDRSSCGFYDALSSSGTLNEKGKTAEKILELWLLPPKTAAQKPWWQKFWDDPLRGPDRLVVP